MKTCFLNKKLSQFQLQNELTMIKISCKVTIECPTKMREDRNILDTCNVAVHQITTWQVQNDGKMSLNLQVVMFS